MQLNDSTVNGNLNVTEDVQIGEISVTEELTKLNSNLSNIESIQVTNTQSISQLNNKMLRGSVICSYSSSDRLYARVTVDSEWNGCVPIVCNKKVDGTPWWNVTVATHVSGGQFEVWVSGSFVSGHVLQVEYLLVKW